MGLFDHLFKNKLPHGDEKMDEVRQTPSLDGTAGAPASPQPDHTVFLHPKAYVPRGGAAPVHPGARPVGQGAGRPAERKTPHPAPPAGGEIVLTLGDVLSRIPTQLLNSGPHDAKRELRFKIGDLSSDIARGRAVVSLSRIAVLCPDIFQKEITVAEDMDVRLPLQKLVEQIGLMRSNPPTPIPEKMARPVPSEAPPVALPTRAPLAMRNPPTVPRQAPQPRADAPNASEHKPRAVSPPTAPQEISKALQENILKAQALPLRRTPVESRHGVPPKQEPRSPDAKGEAVVEKKSEPAAVKPGVVIPFPAIAAKAETGPAKPDEEHAEAGAERALEEKLRQLLAEKAASEGALKPELTAPSHLVTALAEIALQQSLLKTVEAKESRAPDVSLAQPASLDASKELAAKSQLLGLLRRKLEAATEPAELVESGHHKAEDIKAVQASEATEAGRGVIPVKAELKAPENRAAETPQESPKPPAASEPVEINVSGPAPAAALPEEVEGKHIVSKGPESNALEAQTAETFEDKRKETATLGRLEVSVPEANAISAPRAEIARTEFAPAEAKLDKSGMSASHAFDAALKDLPKPESPAPTVLKVGLSATLPIESPYAEGLSKAADSKKPEINAAELLASAPKPTATAALVSGLVSNVESISPPKAEIAQTEIPLKDSEAGKAEIREEGTAEAAEPEEHVKPGVPKKTVSIAAASAGLPVELLRAETASKAAEQNNPEISAAHVFEATLKTTAAPALVEGLASSAESISQPKAEIAHTEIAAKEAVPGKTEIKVVKAHEAAPEILAIPKSPTEPVPKSGVSAGIPIKLPRPETILKAAEPKNPEISAAKVFEDTLKITAAAALVEGLASSAESISQPKAEIAHTEIAHKEAAPGKTEVKVVKAAEVALVKLAILKPPSEPVPETGVSAGIPAELPRPETVSKAAEPKNPEISAAHVFEDPLKTTAAAALVEGLASSAESISQPKVEIAHTEIAPKEAAPGKTEVKVVKAAEVALEKLAILKPPAEPVPETSVSVGIPTELHRPETVSKAAEQTHPEISAAKVFEDTLKTTVATELVRGLVSNADLISPRKAEITQPEVTLNETKPTVAGGKKVDADETALKELAKPKLPTESISKAGPPTGLPASVPHLEAASEKAAPTNPKISAAEVFEDPLKSAVAAALVKGIVSNTESISPPRAEIAQTEVALKEADANNPPAAQAATSEETPNQSTPPKLPEESESKTEAVASFPPEAPPTEIPPQPADLKKSEVSPIGHFEDSMKKSAAPELSDARESAPKPAPHSQVEIAPQEQESKEPEPVAAARAETLKQSENASSLQAEPTPLSATEPTDSHIAPHESIPREPEARMLAANVTDAANQQIKTAAIPAPAEIEPMDAPQAAIMAEAQNSLLSSQPQAPVIDGPTAASQKDQSISALLVSLAALKESAPETSAKSALKVDEDGLPHSKDRVWLSLPPILKYCPREIITGKLPPMDGKIGIELPLSLIEPQIASGHVEISSLRFIAALPPEYMQYFVVREDVKVPIPLAEILRAQQSDLASAGAELGDTARKSEQTTSEPGSPVVAAAESLASHAASAIGQAEAEASPSELPAAIAPSQDPVFGVEPASQGESVEHPLAPDPAPEPIKPPLVLNIPAFRVFAPPPLQVSASIVNAPANPVPLAWMGHVSIQTPRDAEPREHDDAALHSSAPPADSALKPEASAKSPFPDTGALHTAALSPRFEEEALQVSAIPNKSSDPATLPPPAADSARPVESAGTADVPLATPETPQPQGDTAVSTPSYDHSALLHPPVIRPVSIPPPRILAFTPAFDPQTVESAASESIVPVGKEKIPIPPAFFPAPEGSSGVGTTAESQGEETAAETKSSKQDTAASDPAAAAPDSSQAAPRITRKSVREKASVPAPPKIPFSVPNLPDLHVPHVSYVPPVPSAETETPAPELNPVPPPLPLARFDQDVLQRLFMTDEFLDLAAVCRHVSALPGLQACVISRPDENVRAGEIPEGFEFAELLAFAPGVTQVAGRLPIGSLKHFTLYAETHSVSFFERREVCLCVVHRARSFVPGVREKLVTIADELSR